MNVTIIGAGISGLGLAIKLEKYKINYEIIEQTENLGGIWNINNNIANKFSNVQTMCQTYKIEDDKNEYSQYTSIDEIYYKIYDNYEKYNILDKIKYNIKLESFESIENNKVKLILKNLSNNTTYEKITDALYIRTGTLNKKREVILQNEDKFSGKILYGSNYGKDNLEFNDKIVTIIGIGATSVENVRNSLQKGAKKVIILARSFGNIWTRKMLHYMVQELIKPKHYLLNMCRKSSWNNLNQLYNKNIDYFNNDLLNQIRNETTIKIDNALNYNISKVPVLTEDILIYHHYGLVEIHKDEIIDFKDNNVITKNGLNYQSDIILKCTGYEMEESFLDNHKFDNTIFIDGKYNITHNCGVDRSGKVKFIHGPSKDINIFPLVSYPMVNHVFDELSIYFLQYPSRFEVFNNYDLYSEFVSNLKINDIELRNYVYIFWKLISYLKTSLYDIRLTIRIGIHLWNLRQDFLNNLNSKKFLEIDKELWDKTSKFCYSKVSNYKYLEYPNI